MARNITKAGKYGYPNVVELSDKKDTVNIKATKYVTIIAKKGNDVITIKKGNNHVIYGDDNIFGSNHRKYNGNDTITIAAGKGHEIYTDRGDDKIYIKKGAGFSFINAGDGDDVITVDKGAKAGTKSRHSIIGGYAGKDIITVTNGKYYDISGDEGNDTIKITGGSNLKIYSGEGSDIVTVTNAKDFEVTNWGGKDTVTVTGGSNGAIYASCNEKVTINSGSSHMVFATLGWTKSNSRIFVNGGKNIKVTDHSTYTTNDNVTIAGGNGNVNMKMGTDTVTIDFKKAKNIGNWDVSVNNLKDNRLVVTNAKYADFTFERKYPSNEIDVELVEQLGYMPLKSIVMTNTVTGAQITLSGWNNTLTSKPFDIYFKQENITETGAEKFNPS